MVKNWYFQFFTFLLFYDIILLENKKGIDFMAIGIGFANDEYHTKTIEDYYQEELSDIPVGAPGFAKDICYERAVEKYERDRRPEERQQGFI